MIEIMKKRSFLVNKKVGNVLRFCISLLVAYVMIFPILALFFGGFKTQGEILSNPFGFPSPITIETYKLILGVTSSYWRLLLNSTIIAFFTIAVVNVLAMSVGVGLSRVEFRGRKILYNFFLMGMLFPLTVAIIPLYLQLRSYGLTIGVAKSQLGVVLAQAAFNLPLSIFIFTGFFREIPNELQDACNIDGGTLLTFFRRVIIPLSTPVISTVTIIVFIASWNQFLLPLLVLSDANAYTLPLGVMQYQGQFSSNWHQIMAFVTLSVLPISIFYFVLQKYVVEGLTAGAVKG
ncbi:MAG: carbohydrate ABC transporter permease [Spirochaetales bacterium]|nr:carbohydrate ABC transporter permease [Spirochaetales bacterium]